MGEYNIIVNRDNVRLDRYLAEEIHEISRTKAQELIKAGNVTAILGRKSFQPSHKVKRGEEYLVRVPADDCSPSFVSNAKLEVVFEDEYLAVINKRPGITVHKGIGTKNDTLVDLLLCCYGVNGLSEYQSRPGIVHRLDKDTSGLILIAKNNYIHSKLAEAIEKRDVSRKYLAIVHGVLEKTSGVVDVSIGPHRKDKRKMHVSNTGKYAITNYRLLSVIGSDSLVECSLGTGRTHQIRVHMQHIGHPIVGDVTYGKASNIINRQALHAYKLGFVHPHTKQYVACEVDVPEDMRVLIENRKHKEMSSLYQYNVSG